MSKPVQLQFDTGSWLKDPALSMCEPETRGIWIDILCAMHENNRCGQLIGTYSELSRICRCTEIEITGAISQLKQKKAAYVTEFIDSGSNAIITVTNRRMRRDFEVRELGAKRAQKFRDNNRNLPTSEPAKRIAAIFHRRLDTPWSEGEIQSFRIVGIISDEDLNVLELFYKKNKNNERAFLRTGLHAFLNNFRSECDKARAWALKNPKTMNGNGNHKPEDEPEQWREYLSQEYPDAPQFKAWANVPDDLRKRITSR